VALNFGKRHDNVIQKIENLIKSDKSNRLNFKAVEYEDSKGEARKKYIMNRRTFSILVMGFTGEKAMEWKHKFYDAFEKMEEILLRQNNLEWQEYRLNGKGKRLELTDSIQRVVELAERQGSRHASRYYATFTRMIYGQIFNLKAVPDNFRDMLDEAALKKLRLIEEHATIWLNDAVEGADDYHVPYRALKRKITGLVGIVGGIELR
jgi:Rha family phage regulatory protein